MTQHFLVTGGTGQVGRELARLSWPAGFVPVFPERTMLDLTDPTSIARMLDADGHDWVGVINCAAYTAVDRAEGDVANAFLANAQGPAWLAEAAHARGLPIVQVSTDYVFDGSGQGAYRESDPVGPIGAYGASKLAGELAVRAANPASIVLRTAWVLSPFGSSFLKTMLRLAESNSKLRVVADQHGCPTSAKDIAQVLQRLGLRLTEDPACPTGIFHFVNRGEASWYELARFILARSAALGGPEPLVEAITTADYPTPARRPLNSRLAADKLAEQFGVQPRHWQEAVAEIVAELVQKSK
jgi:dTDP-4-dehydrorhamnose reductase